VASVTGVRALNLEGDTLYTTETKWQRLRDEVVAALRMFHHEHPLSAGAEMEAVREKLSGRMPPRLFRAGVEQLEAERAVTRGGSLLRLPDHVVRLRADEQGMADRITALLAQAPLSPPDLKQIERDLGVSRPKLAEVLRVMERERTVVRVTPDLYFLRESIDTVKRELQRHLSDRSDITPATFRDLFGTTRKYAIPLLEFLDREGITVRVGDTRRLKRPA
jgi:selenocysteine-specific elongation factor